MSACDGFRGTTYGLMVIDPPRGMLFAFVSVGMLARRVGVDVRPTCGHDPHMIATRRVLESHQSDPNEF